MKFINAKDGNTDPAQPDPARPNKVSLSAGLVLPEDTPEGTVQTVDPKPRLNDAARFMVDQRDVIENGAQAAIRRLYRAVRELTKEDSDDLKTLDRFFSVTDGEFLFSLTVSVEPMEERKR